VHTPHQPGGYLHLWVRLDGERRLKILDAQLSLVRICLERNIKLIG
jgi:hypothetical protein